MMRKKKKSTSKQKKQKLESEEKNKEQNFDNRPQNYEEYEEGSFILKDKISKLNIHGSFDKHDLENAIFKAEWGKRESDF